MLRADPKSTDFILLQCQLTDPTGLASAAQALCAAQPALATNSHLSLYRAAWHPASQTCYVYGQLARRQNLSADDLLPLVQHWQGLCADAIAVRASRLELAFDAPGVSTPESPINHYVVETDPENGWAEEIFRWYDTEHMPGLAAVPGCIHARRLLNHDHGPLSLACYDLVSEEPLHSERWLAVRGTAWSDIARPHFTNTKRSMMKVMA